MRWRLVLLWLCIALLPLRGWAVGALPPAGAVQGAGHATAEPAVPCHGHGAAAAADAIRHALHHPGHASATPSGAETPAPDLPAPGTCALCDVCHGAVVLPSMFLGGFAPLNPGAPPAWTPRPGGRLAVHELFRPPRA